MITANTMELGGGSKHANFVIHNGAKMISVSVDNSGGKMTHMARSDIRCLFSNATAGIEGKPAVVEDVTGHVFGKDENSIVHGTVENMDKALKWLRMSRWGFEGQTL